MKQQRKVYRKVKMSKNILYLDDFQAYDFVLHWNLFVLCYERLILFFLNRIYMILVGQVMV